MTDLFTEMERYYETGDLPWDAPLPPPEIIALSQRLLPGKALDLGCGTGRTAIFLAQHGWQCDGVDFVPKAITLAQRRAESEGVTGSARFHLGSVTHLEFLHDPYDLAVDIGCLHAQRGPDLKAYTHELARLLRPGGTYMLFGRLLPVPDRASTRGLTLRTIRTLFAPAFVIEHIEYGVSVTNAYSWPSAWFWMHRR